MPGGTSETQDPFNPELYRPSQEVRRAVLETLYGLAESPKYTQAVGRRLFGTQHYATAGWYHDARLDRTVELKAFWFERSRLANFFLNPHRPRYGIGAISIALISPVEMDGGSRRPGPYRIFLYDASQDLLDTCEYDDYEADCEAVAGMGGSEIMRERLEQARRRGDDIVTAELAGELLESLRQGQAAGWRPVP